MSKKTKVTERQKRVQRLKAALSDWRTLNEMISDMDEEDVGLAISMEEDRDPMPRETVLTRLRQRLTGIRVQRVRSEGIRGGEDSSDRR